MFLLLRNFINNHTVQNKRNCMWYESVCQQVSVNVNLSSIPISCLSVSSFCVNVFIWVFNSSAHSSLSESLAFSSFTRRSQSAISMSSSEFCCASQGQSQHTTSLQRTKLKHHLPVSHSSQIFQGGKKRFGLELELIFNK